jgi:ATP-dependent Clp protease ATP-binding subunit ClpA
MMRKRAPVPAEIQSIASRILAIRDQRVILDADLARLYGVTTRRLNEQVKRNRRRFPQDFAFRLRAGEASRLNRSQIATGSQKHRDPRFSPYAFTEHGTIMAAMVLNSPRATELSVYVVRAFVELRETLATHEELAKRLAELETRLEKKLANQDQAISSILSAIRQLMASPEPRRRPIGFVTPDSRGPTGHR